MDIEEFFTKNKIREAKFHKDDKIVTIKWEHCDSCNGEYISVYDEDKFIAHLYLEDWHKELYSKTFSPVDKELIWE